MKYVKEQLLSFGITQLTSMATTGLVAEVRGRNPEKKTIALRADMDALPIVEANEVPYKSKNEGVMHACGHDAHTAYLLVLVDCIIQLKDELKGRVKIIHQHAEELPPGGAGRP